MGYNTKVNHLLTNPYLNKEYTLLPIEESNAANENIKQGMIKAKRNHIKNQAESRRKSLDIIFNA
jgi:hypothetical protein